MPRTYIDSKYGRGFPRWERARVNALINPGSPGAKLYRSRVETASLVAQDQAHRHTAFYHQVNGETKVNYRTCSAFCTAMQIQLENGVVKGALTVESIREAINQAFFGGVFQERYVYGRYGGGYRQVKVLGFDLPSRNVKCHACWRVIHPDGTVTGREASSAVLEELWAKEQDFVNTAYDADAEATKTLLGVVTPKVVVASEETLERTELLAVAPDGGLFTLADVCVVRVTQRELDLLRRVPADGRRDWAEANTLWLDSNSFVDALK